MVAAAVPATTKAQNEGAIETAREVVATAKTRVADAEARVATTKAQNEGAIKAARGEVDAAKARVAEAEARVTAAEEKLGEFGDEATGRSVQQAERAVQRAEAGLQRAEADLQDARAGLQRAEAGLQRAEADLQRAEAGLQRAEDEVAAARAYARAGLQRAEDEAAAARAGLQRAEDQRTALLLELDMAAVGQTAHADQKGPVGLTLLWDKARSASTMSIASSGRHTGIFPLPFFPIGTEMNIERVAALIPTKDEVDAQQPDMLRWRYYLALSPGGLIKTDEKTLLQTRSMNFLAGEFPGLGLINFGHLEKSFSKLNLHSFLITSDSKMDGTLTFKDKAGNVRPGGSVECKSSQYSTDSCNSQAISSAASIAMTLEDQGVPWRQVTVPFFGFTGPLFQFGVVILVGSGVPAAFLTSNRIDSASVDGCKAISAHLAKIGDQLSSLSQMELPLQDVEPREIIEVTLGDTFYVKSPALTTTIYSDLSLESIVHVLGMFEMLSSNEEAREIVCFPCALYDLGAENNPPQFDLVFPNLANQGFTNVPPRDKETATAYIDAFRRAVEAIHSSGVIHCDLYVSNIFWKMKDGGAVAIKIIDWDTAFRCDGPIPERWLEALEYEDGERFKRYKETNRTQDVDLYHVNLLCWAVENNVFDDIDPAGDVSSQLNRTNRLAETKFANASTS